MLKQLASKAFDISNQSSLIAGTPLGNMGGVDVFIHGNPLNNLESSLIHKHMTALTQDYPEVARESVQSLHILNPSIRNPRELFALKEIPIFKKVLEANPLLGMQASGLALAATEENPGGGIILNNPMIRLSASRYGTHKLELNQMTMQDPGSSAMSKEALGETLDHEFGHHVQYSMIQKYLRSLGGAYEEGANNSEGLWEGIEAYHSDILTPIYQKYFPQFTSRPPKPEDIMDIPTNIREFSKYMKQQKTLKASGGQGFDLRISETQSMIGSKYAAVNEKELFAETFARARKGIGVGAEAAQGFINEAVLPVKTAKMLSATESAIKALLDMRG